MLRICKPRSRKQSFLKVYRLKLYVPFSFLLFRSSDAAWYLVRATNYDIPHLCWLLHPLVMSSLSEVQISSSELRPQNTLNLNVHLTAGHHIWVTQRTFPIRICQVTFHALCRRNESSLKVRTETTPVHYRERMFVGYTLPIITYRWT
jgi:hypothetical protein